MLAALLVPFRRRFIAAPGGLTVTRPLCQAVSEDYGLGCMYDQS